MSRIIKVAILFGLFYLVSNIKLNRDYKKVSKNFCNCLEKVEMFSDSTVADIKQAYQEDNISIDTIMSELDTLSEEVAKREMVDMFKKIAVMKAVEEKQNELKEELIALHDLDDYYAEQEIYRLANEFKLELIELFKKGDIEMTNEEIKSIISSVITGSLCAREMKPTLAMMFVPHDRERKFKEKMEEFCPKIMELQQLTK